jgi:hypothetical protein
LTAKYVKYKCLVISIAEFYALEENGIPYVLADRLDFCPVPGRPLPVQIQRPLPQSVEQRSRCCSSRSSPLPAQKQSAHQLSRLRRVGSRLAAFLRLFEQLLPSACQVFTATFLVQCISDETSRLNGGKLDIPLGAILLAKLLRSPKYIELIIVVRRSRRWMSDSHAFGSLLEFARCPAGNITGNGQHDDQDHHCGFGARRRGLCLPASWMR